MALVETPEDWGDHRVETPEDQDTPRVEPGVGERRVGARPREGKSARPRVQDDRWVASRGSTASELSGWPFRERDGPQRERTSEPRREREADEREMRRRPTADDLPFERRSRAQDDDAGRLREREAESRERVRRFFLRQDKY